jgi:pyruvate dehydrogenase E2 component (dihydrolipoamide acetyltransferase)
MAELITMPKLGFDMAEGTLVRWVKAEGDAVAKGDVMAEIETDKATVEVESHTEGIMFRHLAEEETALPVNAPIAIITAEGEELSEEEIAALAGETGGKPAKKPTKKPDKEPKNEVKDRTRADETASDEVSPAGGVRSTPLARRMAEDHNIRLTEIEGTGPLGRVVKKDVEDFLAAGQGRGSDSSNQPGMPIRSFSLGEVPEDQLVDMSRLRQAISRRMQDSNQNFPHFYLTRAYDTGAMMRLRKEINALLPEDEKISVNDFILKAVALALRQYPNLNASLEGEKQIRRHGHVNIGVAVAVEGGLLTVVVKDADQKPVRLIAREVREMAVKAREGKVRPEDIEGSTFSISNLGMYGIEQFSAIINPPEAGILAVGAVQDVPVVVEGQLAIGSRMKVSLSADHRVTDGAEAAEFMQALAAYLEEPMRLMI